MVRVRVVEIIVNTVNDIQRPFGKRVFDPMKDFGTSQSTKIDSIFNSLLCPDRPAYVTIPYCTSTASCSCTTPS
ncbi:MAG: hypothetical protein KZQ63_03365 [Candidatus Thiodiazotropha sp. (ex Lucinoma aequizonata)]|nr:hypothetical protein [Candidatus Thiodiazotropha sp. (ex Lucinoma aequizonata)]